MSVAGAKSPTTAVPARRADTLAESVLLLVSLTVAQRVIGLGRSVLTCRWMEPDQLGLWEMSFSFLTIVPPLVVLGLPGSFGRYVAYFETRGQLRQFIGRTILACTALLAVAAVLLALFRPQLAWLVFNDRGKLDAATLLIPALVVVVAFNFLQSLANGLRMYRVFSGLQFFVSLLFAVFSVLTVRVLVWESAGVVIAYAGACLVTGLGSLFWFARGLRHVPTDSEPLADSGLWRKVLTFAFWVWIADFVGNAFIVIDRYMIVHFSGLQEHALLAALGQYHSSRVVPVLFSNVAAMFAAMLTPHLVEDWERRGREIVSTRLNTMLKLAALALTAGAIVVLLCEPILAWMMRNKYPEGMALLPGTLAYCIWFGLAITGQNYLWCSDRARFSSAALAIGLLICVILNYLLLPTLGLTGAVLATTAGNLAAMCLIYFGNIQLGMKVDRGVWLLSALPAILYLPSWLAGAAFIGVLILAWRSHWLFSQSERQVAGELFGRLAKRICLPMREEPN